jgi:TonB family protein
MSIKSLISSSLRGKKLMFLSMGFMVVFVCGVGLNPIKAQEKRDTVTQKDTIAAVFPGGMQELYNFLGKNIRYPREARDAKWVGTVQIRFVVNQDGAVDSVEVQRSSSYSTLDEEAVRVVKMMPKWIPERVKGEPVASYYNLPIKFQIEDEETEPLKKNKKKK